MDQVPNLFDADPVSPEARLADGLARIATAIRAHDWAGASASGLTPTQGRALALLDGEEDGLRLSVLAQALAVSAPTASDALAALVRKGLVERSAEPGNGRAARFRLSESGRAAASAAAGWPAFLGAAINRMTLESQAALNRLLIELIRTLQTNGDIPIQRMCVTCRWFRPNAHPDDVERPHHCAFVDAAFGDRRLRLDCREQEPASPEDQAALWDRFTKAA